MIGLRKQSILPLSVVVLVTLVSCSVWAEVGVATEGPQVKAIYVNKIIVDDSDPVSSVWIAQGGGPGRHVLNEDGFLNGDGKPSVVYNPGPGLPIVAWAKYSSSGYDVVISSFSNGAWSSPVAVADSSADELDPFLILNPADGLVHLLYWINDSSPRVMYTQALEDLSSWSSPVQVSDIGEAACRPTAVFHENSLSIIYESHGQELGSTPRQIVLATRNGPGFATEVLASTSHPEPNWPEVHSNGEQLWTDWIDGTWEMAWTCRLASGSWDSVQTEHFDSIEERDYQARGSIKNQVLE